MVKGDKTFWTSQGADVQPFSAVLRPCCPPGSCTSACQKHPKSYQQSCPLCLITQESWSSVSLVHLSTCPPAQAESMAGELRHRCVLAYMVWVSNCSPLHPRRVKFLLGSHQGPEKLSKRLHLPLTILASPKPVRLISFYPTLPKLKHNFIWHRNLFSIRSDWAKKHIISLFQAINYVNTSAIFGKWLLAQNCEEEITQQLLL